MTAPQWRHLAETLAHAIRSGQRAPGSRLPSYIELASQGYAQSTVTRAYQELTAQGLLAAVPGSGTYVADPLPDPAPTTTLEELAERVRRIEKHLGL